MIPEERNRAVVEALYAAAGAGDWDAAEALIAENFVITEAETLPFAGRWHGRSGFRAAYERVMAFWEDPVIDIRAITAGDDHVISLLTLDVTARASGRRLAIPLAEAFRLRDGLIAEITPYYFDTGEVARAALG